MGPGEKVGLKWNGDSIEVVRHTTISRKKFMSVFNNRFVLSNDQSAYSLQVFAKRVHHDSTTTNS